MTQLQGLSLIAGNPGAPGANTFAALAPATGATLAPTCHEASAEELERACAAAGEAFASYRATTGAERARFLRAIADEIEALGDALLERFVAESALPAGRAQGERARTCGQLRLFADLIVDGSWADARIDTAQPGRTPLPKPDTRLLLRPIGPVAVFGPANFPLAYTVAGGDTASALAAGCPVVVKAHSSHPGTSELVGHAVVRAVRTCGLHPGVFSLLFGSGRAIGGGLVAHPAIKAVGFTGSQAVGRQLYDRCAARPDPIPFFGELSSINPVCLLPGAMAARADAIATGLHASVTLGVGQFCTNPGLVLFVAGTPGADAFVERLSALLWATPAAAMLNRGTRASYGASLQRVGGAPGVETLLAASTETGPGGCHATAALFRTEAKTFAANHALHEEIFGPATLLVACTDVAEMVATLGALGGQLTATVHGEPGELEAAPALFATLEQLAGRIIHGGFPTGVEVCPSIVHSGPWPATTDVRFTSVGTGAIFRWARPVCYQGFPQSALPPEVRDAATGALRLVNGTPTRDAVG